MAIDRSLKRKRGSPAGSHSAKSKMEQKVALVKQRLALLDSSSSSDTDKEEDYTPIETVACNSELMQNEERDELLALQVSNDDEMYLELSGAPDVSVGISSRAEVSGVSPQQIGASFHNNCGSAMARAKEVHAKLPAQHPSFTKGMLKSHVIRGFWLGLPAKFCNKHLPMRDTIIVLEDENGDKHDANYLAAKQGLSAGWRGFAMKHSLQVGDAVVFELVALGSKTEQPKFKVYIVRAHEFTTADGAVSVLNLEVCKEGKLLQEESAGEEDPEVNTVPGEEVLLIDGNGIISKPIDGTRMLDSGVNGIVSEAIDGIRMLDSDIEFEDVTSFSNFHIVVDGLVIDCKFHDHLRRTYYKLCCSQKAFLHKHLLKQLNLTLVVGVIMETINIAEGIRACKAEASCREDFLIWKKTLESFELLGMDVAFLLKRVDALLGLQTRNLSECQKYEELRLESGRAVEKVKALEVQLSGVKDVLRKLDADMQDMESSVKKSNVALQKLATSPW